MKNSKLNTIFHGTIEYKLKHLENSNKISEWVVWSFKGGGGFFWNKDIYFSNNSWIQILFFSWLKDPKTLEVAMEYVRAKLIFGFDTIHKNTLDYQWSLIVTKGSCTIDWSITWEGNEWAKFLKNLFLINPLSAMTHDWDQFEKLNESILKELNTFKRAIYLPPRKKYHNNNNNNKIHKTDKIN